MNHIYEKHIFVCENIREGENARVSCGKFNSKKIREYLKQKIKASFPEKKIRVNMSGCLDRCELGPILVSYPEGDWFALKNESDVDAFINSYIKDNTINGIENLNVL